MSTDNSIGNVDVKETIDAFVWKIPDFAACLQDPPVVFKSPDFESNDNYYCTWHLTLDRPEDQDCVAFAMYIDIDDKNSILNGQLLSLQLAILSAEGVKTCVKSVDLVFPDDFGMYPDGSDKRPGFQNFISKEYLTSQKAVLFPDDEITLYIELSFRDEPALSVTKNRLRDDMKHCEFASDFAALLDKQLFTDIRISVEGKEIGAHKCILGARSSVFRAMFEHEEMMECAQKRVDIADFSFPVIEEMLRYIYTNRCGNLKGKARELLAAADKYDLDGLKSLCEEALVKYLDVLNAVETLASADLHSALHLRKAACRFICDNAFEVVQTPGWKSVEIERPALISELFVAATQQLKKDNEDD